MKIRSIAFSICFVFQLGLFQATGQEAPHSFPHYYTQHAMHADCIELSHEEKVALTDVVLDGVVVATRTFMRDGRMASELQIESIGNGAIYDVQLRGGSLGNVGAFYSGEMYLNAGAEGRFYLQGSAETEWKPAVGTQSFEAKAKEVNVMGLNRSTVELSANWLRGNGTDFLTITGTGFGADQGAGYVAFETGNGYNDASTAAQFNYTEWTDNSITIEVPQAQSNYVRVYTNSGEMFESSDSLHIRYNLGSAPYSHYGSTHLNNQGTGGHFFHVHEELFNFPERLDAVQRTLADFVCKTGVNFQLSPEATTLGWDLGDGQNTISFDSPENPLSAGTVGYCNTLWWSCILGDETFYVVGEMDVVLNSNFDYDYSTGPVGEGQAKFAYVLMHELGHAMRLGHVNEWGETMYPSVTNQPSNNWCERDTISTNDRLGVTQSVEIASTFTFSACGISAMVPLEVDCIPLVGMGEVEDHEMRFPYPNPFQDRIHVFGDSGNSTTWNLYAVTGQLLLSEQVTGSGAVLDASGLPRGSYVLRCADCDQPASYRVLKDR